PAVAARTATHCWRDTRQPGIWLANDIGRSYAILLGRSNEGLDGRDASRVAWAGASSPEPRHQWTKMAPRPIENIGTNPADGGLCSHSLRCFTASVGYGYSISSRGSVVVPFTSPTTVMRLPGGSVAGSMFSTGMARNLPCEEIRS